MRTNELKGSFEKLGEIYPVLVDKGGSIIDGNHRKKVNPKWREEKVDTDDPIKISLIRIAANITRRAIPGEEITRELDNLAKLTRWSVPRIAEEIGRPGDKGEQWVRHYISEKYKDAVRVEAKKKADESRSVVIMTTEDEPENNITETEPQGLFEVVENNKSRYTEEVGVSIENEAAVSDFVDENKIEDEEESIEEIEEIFSVNIEDGITNVWISDGKRGEGKRIYGDPTFHGNTPPVLAYQCLMKYSKDNDLILDPMAGSGTLIDLCNDFNRRILALDIKPRREDIQYGDAQELPIEDESIDMIFAHFPYWDMAKYSDNKEDLSNKSLNEFLEKAKLILKEFHRILKSDKYCCILIGDKRKDGLIDLSARVSLLGSEFMQLFDKVIWVGKKRRSSTGIQNNLTKWRAEHFGYHIQIFDTLLIFRK